MSDTQKYFSGSDISKMLNISRAAISKQVKILSNDGVKIDARQNKGYMLMSIEDSISPDVLGALITTKYLGHNMAVVEAVASTNTLARELAHAGCENGTVIIAKEQNAGRGRRGRSWIAANGKGVCMSIVIRPNIPPNIAPRYTVAAALAVRNTLDFFGVPCGIKWPNDILADGKKLCGILLELGSSTEHVDYIVIGIGINVNEDKFDEEIESVATSCALVSKKYLERARVAARVLLELEPLIPLCETNEGFEVLIKEYCQHSLTLGKRVRVEGVSENAFGVVTGFDTLGRIILVDDDGIESCIDSGDVSLR